jgi:large subunit ribosomal protein L15
MNELSRLRPPKGAHKTRRRVGRGIGSGLGKTAGRGQKGQKARSAAKSMQGFEGGQMPLQRRLPKRGFEPLSRTTYMLVNVLDLEDFEAGTVVTPELLAAEGLIRSAKGLVKILGDGDLSTKLTVQAHKFSKSAVSKIEQAGGTAEVLAKAKAARADAGEVSGGE